MKRTYYVIEMGCPSYPVHELRVSTKKPADETTAKHAHKVRAATRQEAEQTVRNLLSAERFEALVEQSQNQ